MLSLLGYISLMSEFISNCTKTILFVFAINQILNKLEINLKRLILYKFRDGSG